MKRAGLNNYTVYKRIQKSRAKEKWGSVTFDGVLFGKMMEHVKEYIVNSKMAVCMGIRKGNEYEEIKKIKFLSLDRVYGVDIHPKVKKVGTYCYAYDFNKLPKKWENKFDLLYSNSIDHAFDIKKTLGGWWRVVKGGGYLVLNMSACDVVSFSDLYAFVEGDYKEFVDMDKFDVVEEWGEDEQVKSFNLLLRVKK